MTHLLSGAAGRPVSPDGRAADGPWTHHRRMRDASDLLNNGAACFGTQSRCSATVSGKCPMSFRSAPHGTRRLAEGSRRPTRSAPPVTLAFDARRALCVFPIDRHGFANQYEAQTGTVPVEDIKPFKSKPQTDADGLRSRSPSVPAAKPNGYCGDSPTQSSCQIGLVGSTLAWNFPYSGFYLSRLPLSTCVPNSRTSYQIFVYWRVLKKS